MVLGVYQAMEVLEQALGSGAETPDAIKRFFLSGPTLQTTFGPVAFDESGDIQSPCFFISNIRKEFSAQ